MYLMPAYLSFLHIIHVYLKVTMVRDLVHVDSVMWHLPLSLRLLMGHGKTLGSWFQNMSVIVNYFR